MKTGVRSALMGAAILLVSAGAPGGFAQSEALSGPPNPGAVVVTGYGAAEREAEKVHIIAEARGRASDAAAALKAAGEQRDKLMTVADGVKAAESVSTEQTGVEVSAVLPNGCTSDESYSRALHTTKCRPEGYDATIRLSFIVRPAKAAGALAALLIEGGANEVTVDSINDTEQHPDLDRAALAAAFADARSRAELLAAAGGARLGRVISVVHAITWQTNDFLKPPPPPPPPPSYMRPGPPKAPRSLTPQTALELQPPKLRAVTSVNVTFEWLK